MPLSIPNGPGDLTPDWLARALGRITGPFQVIRIGEDAGFTGGALYRLTAGTESWVVKLSPSDPAARALFARANRREVALYTELGAGLPVPDCAYGRFDPETGASVLVLQDLAGFRPGNFLSGLSAQEAAAVADALADIHAVWWDRPEARALSGADCLDEFGFAECWQAYPQALFRLLPDMALPPGFLSLGDHIAANACAIFGTLLEDGPVTVLHRDCQADNVMFSDTGRAVLYDWQFMGKGRGVYDVALMLASSVPPALRREIEKDVVRRYHRRLCDAGVAGYGWDQCWREYRQGWIARLFLTTVATVLLDNSSDHRRAWRRADLQRLLAFRSDHGLGLEDYPV